MNRHDGLEILHMWESILSLVCHLLISNPGFLFCFRYSHNHSWVILPFPSLTFLSFSVVEFISLKKRTCVGSKALTIKFQKILWLREEVISCPVKSSKLQIELPNVWGEYKYHGNPYIQGSTVPCDT